MVNFPVLPVSRFSDLTFRAITRDESVYPDAADFNPDRWLNPKYPTYQEPLSVYPNIKGFTTTFGYGRRVCQGQDLVEAELLVGIGGMAWACNINKRRDSAGNEIPVPAHDYSTLLISRPNPFAFDLQPRSKKREQQVWDNYGAAVNKDALERGMNEKTEVTYASPI